jgi:hypothetical protein
MNSLDSMLERNRNFAAQHSAAGTLTPSAAYPGRGAGSGWLPLRGHGEDVSRQSR